MREGCRLHVCIFVESTRAPWKLQKDNALNSWWWQFAWCLHLEFYLLPDFNIAQPQDRSKWPSGLCFSGDSTTACALESSVYYICLNSVARQQSGELQFKLSYCTIEVVPNICGLSLNGHLCWFRTCTSQTFHNKKECYHICSFNLACHHYTTLDCAFK